MFKWHFNMDIIGLLKTMKSEYLEDSLKKGRLFFNFPLFYDNAALMPAQYDKYDSWEDVDAYHLIFAPIIKETDEGSIYGQIHELAEHADLHVISKSNKKRPICCFRAIKENDLIQKGKTYIFSLGNTVDRVKNEFGHDAFVYYMNPFELHRRLNEKVLFYGHEVFYGKYNSDFWEFMDNTGLECSGMFQKDEKYSWQKEYRIVLSPRESNIGFPIDIGDITDIAYGGNIEQLRNGGVAYFEEE